jgi:hypothetical protein
MENCPKCDAKINKNCIKKMSPIQPGEERGHYYVKCPKCACEGPIYPDTPNAQWAWDYMCRIERVRVCKETPVGGKTCD